MPTPDTSELSPDDLVQFLALPTPRSIPPRFLRAAQRTGGLRGSFWGGLAFVGFAVLFGAALWADYIGPNLYRLLRLDGAPSAFNGMGIALTLFLGIFVVIGMAVVVKEGRQQRVLRRFMIHGRPVMARVLRVVDPERTGKLRIHNSAENDTTLADALLEFNDTDGAPREARTAFPLIGPYVRRLRQWHKHERRDILALVLPDDDRAVVAQLWLGATEPVAAPVATNDNTSAAPHEPAHYGPAVVEFLRLPPPRDIPPAFERRLRDKGWTSVALIVFFAIPFTVAGLAVMAFTVPWRLPLDAAMALGVREAVPGEITAVRPANVAYNGVDVLREELRFRTLDGREIVTRGYRDARPGESRKQYEGDETVGQRDAVIVYCPWNPAHARTEAGRTQATKGFWFLLGIPFAGIGLGVGLTPWWTRRTRRRLLKEGRFARGRIEEFDLASESGRTPAGRRSASGGRGLMGDRRAVVGVKVRYWPSDAGVDGGSVLASSSLGIDHPDTLARLRAAYRADADVGVLYCPQSPDPVLLVEALDG